MTVDGNGGSFTFTVVVRKADQYFEGIEIKKEIFTLGTPYGELPVTIVYDDNVTHIVPGKTDLIKKSIAIDITPGEIVFTPEKTGVVSASLYSIAGKKIFDLLSNQIMVQNNSFRISMARKPLSSGHYILQFTFTNDESRFKGQRKIIVSN